METRVAAPEDGAFRRPQTEVCLSAPAQTIVGRKSEEVLRLGVLALAAAWLLHPFFTGRRYGSGDALWYANMLADFVTQLRAGVFPIFAGQTEFAFNGAVYPLRVCPMYQHLAGALDLIAGRTLGFFALQHLTVIFCGVAGIYTSYLTLCRVAPDRRWQAVGLAVLYLSCPGLMATIYTQDLYMTWMSVPLLPLAVYGIVRTFRKDDLVSQFWLAAPLAALWWAHSPVALWFTFIALGSQVWRLAFTSDRLASLKKSALGAGIFMVLAQYPFISVAEIGSPGSQSTVIESIGHTEQISDTIRQVFPSVILPLTQHAGTLGDLQLGYSFWAILILSVASLFRFRSRELAVLLAGAVFLLVLLLPVPGLNFFVWSHIPTEVVRITYYWPMQRFYPIAAALLAASAQIAFARVSWPKARSAVSAFLMACCLWSLWESRQFIGAAQERTGSDEMTARSQMPENLFLMNHDYGLFPQLPAYFTNGVVDPRSQVRLISLSTGKVIPEAEGKIVRQGPLSGTLDFNSGVLDFVPPIRLEPGRRYELEFSFAKPGASGILQFTGSSTFREYPLPSAGGPLAFGDKPANPHKVDLWTTDPEGDTIRIRFVPIMSGDSTADFETFGSIKLTEIDSTQQPVELVSLLPFRAHVSAPTLALLESPRMFMPGYRSLVDGREAEVIRSHEGLASVVVNRGTHTVSLWFAGPALLKFSYWAALAAWTALLIASGWAAIRSRS